MHVRDRSHSKPINIQWRVRTLTYSPTNQVRLAGKQVKLVSTMRWTWLDWRLGVVGWCQSRRNAQRNTRIVFRIIISLRPNLSYPPPSPPPFPPVFPSRFGPAGAGVTFSSYLYSTSTSTLCGRNTNPSVWSNQRDDGWWWWWSGAAALKSEEAIIAPHDSVSQSVNADAQHREAAALTLACCKLHQAFSRSVPFGMRARSLCICFLGILKQSMVFLCSSFMSLRNWKPKFNQTL